MIAILWHYITVDLTLNCHSYFVHGPFAALQILRDHAAVVMTAITPPAASAPRELCYCIVKVIRLYRYLLLFFVESPLIGRLLARTSRGNAVKVINRQGNHYLVSFNVQHFIHVIIYPCILKQILTLGCVNDLLAGEPATLLCLHRSKGYGFMTTVSLGLSTAYHLCLKP